MIKKQETNLIYPLTGKDIIVYNKKGEILNEGIVLEETKYSFTLKSYKTNNKSNLKQKKNLRKYLKNSVWIKLKKQKITFPADVIIAKQHDKIKKLIKKLKIK